MANLDEARLIEKLRAIESLYARPGSAGERAAAEGARERILERLRELASADPPVEYRFTMADMWSRRVFVALLRRYGIQPYRFRGQRYTTVMAKVSKRFVDETLWPEFEAVSTTLRSYLDGVTSRVVSQVIHADVSEAPEVDEPKQLPLDVELRDEQGRSVRLGQYFGKKPVVLTLVYYECPMLCTLTLNGLAGALRTLSFDAGKEFEIVTVSFEPKDTPALAAAKKAAYLERYQRPGAEAGWHFLTGDADQIARLTGAVGFRYAWDEATRQYAHPGGIVVATPEGRLARYLYGVEYAPRDLRLALIEASAGKIGTKVDQIVLYCYQYDPSTGRYSAALMRMIRVGGAATVLGLGAFVVVMLRREKQAREVES